jgi:hypothetical protein
VLVTVEALRADRLAPYGGPIATPSLAKLAAATKFTDAVSVSPLSRPAVSAILTGVAPDRTKVRDSLVDRLPAETPTLAERLKAAGWTTASFIGSASCGTGSGLERGFGLIDGPPQPAFTPLGYMPPPVPAAKVTGNAATWIGSADPKASVFAWIHLGDLERLPGSLDDVSTAEDAYAKAVRDLDAALGPLFDALAKREHAEIVVVGTHGLYLGEQGRFGDGFWLDATTLRVPLLWSGGRGKGGADDRPAWLPDVATTLAASAGVSLGSGTEGIDLAAAPAAGRRRFAWSWYPEDQLAWPALAAVATEKGFEPQTERPAVPRPRVISAATRELIAASGVKLGTTSKAWPAPPEGAEDVIQRLGRAYYLLGEVRDGPARVVARQGLVKHPDDLGLLTIHLYVMHRATAREPVQDTVSKLETLYPDRPQALHWLAHFESSSKQPERAYALTLAAAEIIPNDGDLLYDLACARSIAKDVPGGLGYLDRALKAGFQDWDWIDKDPDLAVLRADPGYASLRRAAGR